MKRITPGPLSISHHAAAWLWVVCSQRIAPDEMEMCCDAHLLIPRLRTKLEAVGRWNGVIQLRFHDASKYFKFAGSCRPMPDQCQTHLCSFRLDAVAVSLPCKMKESEDKRLFKLPIGFELYHANIRIGATSEVVYYGYRGQITPASTCTASPRSTFRQLLLEQAYSRTVVVKNISVIGNATSLPK